MSEIQENTEARLATYIDGELEGAERAEIEKLLEQHPNYRRVLEQLRVTRELLSGLPRETAPPELSEAFNGQLERTVLLEGISENRRRGAAARGFPQFAAIAAILVLTAGLGLAVYFALPKGKTPTQFADVRLRSTGPVASSATENENLPDEEVAPTTSERSNVAGAAATAPMPMRMAPAAAPTETTAVPAVAPAEPLALTTPPPVPGARGGRGGRGGAGGGGGGRGGFGGGGLPAAAGEVAVKPSPEEADEGTRLLAQNVYQNAQVQDLLKNSGAAAKRSANVTGNLAAEHPDDAVVVVVRSANPAELNRDMLAYFGANNISWESMPADTQLALNNTLSNNLFQEKSAIAADAVKSLNDSAANREKQSTGQGPQAPVPGPTSDKLERADSAKSSSVGASANQSNSLPQFVEKTKALDQLRPVDGVYVARRLSARQAIDLNATLSRRGQVQQAAMAGRDADQGIAGGNGGNSNFAMANSPLQTGSAANADPANRARLIEPQRQQQGVPRPADGVSRDESSVPGSLGQADRSAGGSAGANQQVSGDTRRGSSPALGITARNGQAGAIGGAGAPPDSANGSNKELQNTTAKSAVANQVSQQNQAGFGQMNGANAADTVNLIIVVQKDASAVAGLSGRVDLPQTQPAAVKN